MFLLHHRQRNLYQHTAKDLKPFEHTKTFQSGVGGFLFLAGFVLFILFQYLGYFFCLLVCFPSLWSLGETFACTPFSLHKFSFITLGSTSFSTLIFSTKL